MTGDSKKRGPKPETFKVPLPFDEAVKAALETPPLVDKGREQVLSDAYAELHAQLSKILYEEDPLGAGISVESPLNEYDSEAAKLAARLRQFDGDVAEALDGLFEDPAQYTEDLPKRVGKAWQTFSAETAR